MPMTILFHFQPCVYLVCYQICSWIAAMPLINENGMKTSPDTFQFMILSPSSLAPVELLLLLDTSTYITSQDCVKVLGITFDKQLTFNEHMSLYMFSPEYRSISIRILVVLYTTYSLYTQQLQLLPTRLAFLWQVEQCKTRNDSRTIASYLVQWRHFIVRRPKFT